MSSLADHQSSRLVKLLMLGNSGTGKTGALATLASAGYRLFIADFDNGLDILLDPTVLDPKFRGNVFYKSMQDKPVKVGDKLVPRATAWQDLQKALGGWTEVIDGKTENLGNITTWTDKDVLVVDSLTFASQRAMDDALQLAGRLGQRPQIQDYGAAMDNIESMLEMLYGSTCACNVVMTAHFMFMGDEMTNAKKAFPNVLGQKLAPKVPRYFNTVVQMEKQVVGNTIKRRIKTVGTHLIDLKTSKPGLIPPEIEPDLGKLFAALRGEAKI